MTCMQVFSMPKTLSNDKICIGKQISEMAVNNKHLTGNADKLSEQNEPLRSLFLHRTKLNPIWKHTSHRSVNSWRHAIHYCSHRYQKHLIRITQRRVRDTLLQLRKPLMTMLYTFLRSENSFNYSNDFVVRLWRPATCWKIILSLGPHYYWQLRVQDPLRAVLETETVGLPLTETKNLEFGQWLQTSFRSDIVWHWRRNHQMNCGML